MRPHRLSLVCTLPALVSLAGFTPARAQDAVPPGARVRVFAIPLAHPLTGTFAGADSTSLQLDAGEDQGQVDILRGAVTRFEVSRGKEDYPLQGAVLGGLFGALSATAVGLIVVDQEGDASGCYDCIGFARETSPAYYTLGGAALGLVFGMLVGASINHERWESVEIPASASAVR